MLKTGQVLFLQPNLNSTYQQINQEFSNILLFFPQVENDANPQQYCHKNFKFFNVKRQLIMFKLCNKHLLKLWQNQNLTEQIQTKKKHFYSSDFVRLSRVTSSFMCVAVRSKSDSLSWFSRTMSFALKSQSLSCPFSDISLRQSFSKLTRQ